MKRNKFKSILKHLTSEDIDKKINNLNEKMSTSGMYDVRALDSGTPATPDIPAVAPTYADVDPGGITHPDDFSWPDQGDGSDPNAAPVIPTNFLTTYDTNLIGAMRTLDTYNGQPIDYGGELPVGTLVTRGGWLNWDYIGYLSASGIQIVGTTFSTTTDLARAIYDAWVNWPYPGRVQKTITQWGPLDCLLGTCRQGIAYYPEGSSNTTIPRAERALYTYQLWIPTDENGNVLRNRVQTDPGSPLIPGDPAVPPKLVTMSRNNLGDPNYYPGPIEPQIQDQLNVGRRGYDYLNQASGGEEEEEFGPGRQRGFRLPGMFAGSQSDQQQAETQPTQQEPAQQELTSADFSNYSDYKAFKDGGGNAAVKQGKTLQQVIDQGKKNQSAASSSQQSDSKPKQPDSQPQQSDSQSDSQFGPGKGRGFKLPGFGTPQQSDSGYSGPTGYQYAKSATNVAGGTKFNPSLQAMGSQGKGLGGEIKVGQHGTGPEAAKSIKKGGFRAGSRQNVYGTKSVFLDPSKSGVAADEFARAGAAAEAGGKGTVGRTAAQRLKDLKAAGSAGKGTKIPVAYKPGTGARMNIPGTKYAEVGVDASKATKGMRLMQNAATKYPNSAKAAQLLRTGGTTAKLGLARTAASKLGRAVPFAGAALSVADAAVRVSQGDYAGAIMSGLSAIPGPVGWAALGAQLIYDASRSMKEEVEYNDYNEYLANVREVAKQKGIKFDNNSIDLLRNELALNDKLDDEDKEYLVDIFDNPDNVNPDEMSEFIQRIVSKLSSEGEQVSESVVLSEGWQSPDHVNVERDPKKRWFNPTAGTNSKYWFDPNDIAPDYPNNPPPEMVDGYSSKSNLAPKSLDQTNPFITITKKDLTRNHRLKDSEIAEMMDTINRINAFLAAHPEELVYAQRRYPKGDPRLAELNWKQDQMMRASNQYMETHFPENEKLFTKLKATIERNIQLTDPSTFKYTPDPVTHNQVTEEVKPRRSISKYMKKYEKKPNRSFLKKKKK